MQLSVCIKCAVVPDGPSPSASRKCAIGNATRPTPPRCSPAVLSLSKDGSRTSAVLSTLGTSPRACRLSTGLANAIRYCQMRLAHLGEERELAGVGGAV